MNSGWYVVQTIPHSDWPYVKLHVVSGPWTSQEKAVEDAQDYEEEENVKVREWDGKQFR